MNITGIKKLAKEGKSPYFFSPDTMKFFNSKVYKDIKTVKDGHLFITSEVFGNDPRHYAVRFIFEDGSIDTIIKFYNLKDAKQYLKSY